MGHVGDFDESFCYDMLKLCRSTFQSTPPGPNKALPPNADTQFAAPSLPFLKQDTSRNQTEQVQPSAPEVIHYPESGSSDPSPTLGT